MFGSIGTFNAAGSKFNNAAGDQYNTNVAPTRTSRACSSKPDMLIYAFSR